MIFFYKSENDKHACNSVDDQLLIENNADLWFGIEFDSIRIHWEPMFEFLFNKIRPFLALEGLYSGPNLTSPFSET